MSDFVDCVCNPRWWLVIVPVMLIACPIALVRAALFGLSHVAEESYRWIDWRCGNALRAVRIWVWPKSKRSLT